MGQGYAVQAGFKTGSTWLSSTAYSAVDTAIPIISEGITAAFDKLRSEALVGQASTHSFVNGTPIVSGDLVFEMDFANAADLLTQGIGSRTTTDITLSNDITGNVFYLEIDKVTEEWRFPACMIDKLVFAGEIGSEKPVTVTATIVAVAFPTISTAGFPAISIPATDAGARVYPEHGRSPGYLRVADQANALAAGDYLYFKNFEITIENNLQTDAKDSADSSVRLPARNGLRTVGLKVGMARYEASNSTLLTWKNAGTALQASLLLDGGTPTALFEFPNIRISDGADFGIGGPGVIEGEVSFDAYYNGTINAYMTVTDQMQLTLSAAT